MPQAGTGLLLASATPATALWHLRLGKEDVLANDGVELRADEECERRFTVRVALTHLHECKFVLNICGVLLRRCMRRWRVG